MLRTIDSANATFKEPPPTPASGVSALCVPDLVGAARIQRGEVARP
jgi:hypothetical protein